MPQGSRRRRDRPTILVTVGNELARGIASHQPRGGAWELLLCRPEEIGFATANPQRLGLSGGILQDVDPRHARSLVASGLAVVLIDQPPQPDLATVSSDGARIGELAYRTLRARGFRRFGFWGVPGYWTSDRRQAGFIAAIARGGHVLHPGERPPLGSLSAITRAAMTWLRAAPKPIAIFTDSALRALEMLWATRLAGLQVPDQVAILAGSEDPLRCTLNHPTLSAIDPGHLDLGRTAAGLLDDLLRRRRPARRGISVAPKQVIERRSTDTHAEVPAMVATALRCIHQRAAEHIGVPQVVHEAGVPRRTLELAFRTHLDRSIGEAITLARMAVVRRLLEQTRLGLPEICEQSGISYPSLLSRVFKRHVGMAPREYRMRYGEASGRSALDG